MRYELRVTVNKLDGTTDEKTSKLQTRAEALYAIAHELRNDDFARSIIFTVVADRS
jgi:hypothetical protein